MAKKVRGVFCWDAVMGGMRQRGGCHVREPVLSAAGDLAGVMGPATGSDDDQGRDVQSGELAGAWAPGQDDLCAAEVLPGGDDGEPGRVERAIEGNTSASNGSNNNGGEVAEHQRPVSEVTVVGRLRY